jgi:hypothetical protein
MTGCFQQNSIDGSQVPVKNINATAIAIALNDSQVKTWLAHAGSYEINYVGPMTYEESNPRKNGMIFNVTGVEIETPNSLFDVYVNITNRSVDNIWNRYKRTPEIALPSAPDNTTSPIATAVETALNNDTVESYTTRGYTIVAVITEPIWKNGVPIAFTEVQFDTLNYLVSVDVDVPNKSIVNLWAMPKSSLMQPLISTQNTTPAIPIGTASGKCSESLMPGQNMIINETQSNATICAKLNSSLSIMLGDYTRTGFNWAITGTPGLKITDEGFIFYWYYPNWTPMTTLEASNYTGPSIQTSVNEWNVTMVNTGIQTMKGVLIFPGAPPSAPINDRVFNLTIVVE